MSEKYDGIVNPAEFL
jgi:hypothetical protein